MPPASSPHALTGSCSCLWLTVASNRLCKGLAPSIDHSCSTYPLRLATLASAPFRGSQSPGETNTQKNSRSSLPFSFSPCSLIKSTTLSQRCWHGGLRWRGGTLTELDLSLPRMKPRGLHTDEDTVSLLHRLAVHYPDDVIAGILNRQGRKTASGERFTALHVGSLRRYRNIPRYQPPAEPPGGQVVPIRQAAQILGVYPSTIHRWLNDGFIAGEQLTPGAPWQIRITDELRARFVEQAPPEFICPCWKQR